MDVHYLSFIFTKACELSFVSIGVHRKRLIPIPEGAPMGGSTEIVFMNHAQVRSLLIVRGISSTGNAD